MLYLHLKAARQYMVQLEKKQRDNGQSAGGGQPTVCAQSLQTAEHSQAKQCRHGPWHQVSDWQHVVEVYL